MYNYRLFTDVRSDEYESEYEERMSDNDADNSEANEKAARVSNIYFFNGFVLMFIGFIHNLDGNEVDLKDHHS